MLTSCSIFLPLYNFNQLSKEYNRLDDQIWLNVNLTTIYDLIYKFEWSLDICFEYNALYLLYPV